jgi:hypothetical protein
MMDHLNKKKAGEVSQTARRKVIYSLLLFFFFFNFGHNIALAVTENVTVSAQVGGVVVPPGGGGGGGGGIGIPPTSVRFSGEAYPFATVTILKSGIEAATVAADSRGLFTATLEEQYDSTIIYSLYARDVLGNKSLLINYPIVVQVGFLTHLSGIRFAPTIVTDKAEVRFGDYLTITGYSLPSVNIEVFVESKGEQAKKSFTLSASAGGSYKIILPMQGLPKGDYVVYVKYSDDDRISKLVKFIIGEANVPNVDIVENIPGDCNYDSIINLVDFSVLAFWYGKANPPVCVDTNKDNKIDLVDFSILAFWWTG